MPMKKAHGLDKNQVRGWLVALSTLGAAFAGLTSTKYDDRVVLAFQRLASNDGALDYLTELVDIFSGEEEPSEEKVNEMLSKVGSKPST